MFDQETPLPPCSFVIFGATGNLATLKLLPALYRLELAGRLPEGLSLIAQGRREFGDEGDEAGWRAHVVEACWSQKLKPEAAVLARFIARFDYLRGELNEGETYTRLKEVLAKPKMGVCSNVVFYLAIKPGDFAAVIKHLDACGLNKPRGLHRIVVEKPFGSDIESARVLNQLLHRYFEEEQVFRIDHYMGKETVQNLLVFRFANTLIENLWNRNYIDHVQITVAEEVGIGNRADYYDKAGAMRDMLQNHLMQLMTLVAMEPPPALEADALRDEKVKVLRSIRPIPRRSVHAHAFRAQYKAGRIGAEMVPGYQDEAGVEAGFRHRNLRRRQVLHRQLALARRALLPAHRQAPEAEPVHDRHPLPPPAPATVPGNTPGTTGAQLDRALHPAGGIHAHGTPRQAAGSGHGHPGAQAQRQLPQSGRPAAGRLRGAVAGRDRRRPHPVHPLRRVEWAWRVVDPILKHWAQERDFIHTYPAGSWGPIEANRLFDGEDTEWRNGV
jgi:glucose-6-phosphate 1-dehydrogenase